MIYIDTNVIVYSYVNPEDPKHITSKHIIEELMSENNLILSPLILQELIFVLNKSGMDKDFRKFRDHTDFEIEILMESR